MLYEMATGRRAFEGTTQASLISAIMRDTPRPMSQLAPLSPPALERLVSQCLAKAPDERWTAAQERGGSLSPDGRWVAYVADENGRRGLYVQSFPEPGAKYQVAFEDAAGVRWSERGDALLVASVRRELFEIVVSTVHGFRQGATTRLFQLPRGEDVIDVARGEQRVLTSTLRDPSASTRLEVVLGWPHLLEKR